MFQKIKILLVVCCLTLLFIPLPSWADQSNFEPSSLRVVTGKITPFVFEEGGELVGFSIDLLNALTLEIGIKKEITVKTTVPEILKTIRENQADLGIGALSITKERDKEFDFSYPIFQSGLQILIPVKQSGVPLLKILENIFSVSLLQLIALTILASLIPIHLIWWLESRTGQGIITTKAYFPGIFKAAWWVLSTLATQAEEMPKSWQARVVAVFWMFISVVFVAYFTATITSSLTVQQLQSSIQSVQDLPGKRVLTVEGTTSADYLRQEKIAATEVTRIKDAYEKMLNDEADAIVFDSPVLRYYAVREGKGKVQLVGNVFQPENYGIIFPVNSRYRRNFNNALLTLQQNGTYQAIYKKWFGSESDSQ